MTKIQNNMDITDGHANIGWDVSNTRKNMIPVEQSYMALLEKMRQYGVSNAVVVPFPSPGGQFDLNTAWYDMENHYLIEATKFSERLIPFVGVNPSNKESVRNVNTLTISFDIKGIKLSHQIPMGFSIDRLIDHPLMEIVQDNDLIFMIHIGTGKEKGSGHVHVTLDHALEAVKHYPDVRFILCHIGRLHCSLMEALSLDNVYMDTAGLSLWQNWPQFIALEPVNLFKSSTPVGVIEKLIAMGYGDKLIFGSDEPYTDYRDEIDNIKKARISRGAKRRIFHSNIGKLLKL